MFFEELAHETIGRFIGPMPLHLFMDYYLPPTSDEAPMPQVQGNLFAGLMKATEFQSYSIVVSYD